MSMLTTETLLHVLNLLMQLRGCNSIDVLLQSVLILLVSAVLLETCLAHPLLPILPVNPLCQPRSCLHPCDPLNPLHRSSSCLHPRNPWFRLATMLSSRRCART
jgi:hypothetical protein